MTDYTFKPSSTSQSAQWDSTSSWVGGVVPNAPDADVNFPLVTTGTTGQPYLTSISITSGESYSVHSIQLNDNLNIVGALSVSADMTDGYGGLTVAGSLTVGGTLSDADGISIQMSGGTVSAQSLVTGAGNISGSGHINAGSLNNAANVIGSADGLSINATALTNSGTLGYINVAITATTLTNSGTILATAGTTTVTVTAGGFTNLTAGTLTGGSYSAYGSSTLAIDAGGVISTNAANITLDTGMMTSHDPVSGQNVPLTTSLHAIAPTGHLTLLQENVTFGALNVAGALNLGDTQLTSSQLVIASGGVLDGSSSSVNAPIENNGVIAAHSTPLVVNGPVTGTGHFEVGASGHLEINGATAQTVVFDSPMGGPYSQPGTVQLDASNTFNGSLTPSGHGDRIILPNIAASSIASYSYTGNTTGGTLHLEEQGGGSVALNFNGNFTASDFHVSAGPQTLSSDPPSLLVTVGTAPPVCFLAGTRILTPYGETEVDRLRVGDDIVTWSGEAKTVAWLGSTLVRASGGEPGSRAVVIRAGALDDGVPCRDLRVTEGHSLYLDGILIPAGMLINGRSIEWDSDAEPTRVYHVELAEHDILVADGAPAESYRDDGNRRAFDNGARATGAATKPAYATVCSEGANVDAAWRRIVARTGRAQQLSDDADLHLLVDGERLDPARIEDGTYHFAPRPRARSILIGSRAVVPAIVGSVRDHRHLGVALEAITIITAQGATRLDYASRLLDKGFHEAEHGGRLRWTNGAAELPLSWLGNAEPFEVALKVACFAQYAA